MDPYILSQLPLVCSMWFFIISTISHYKVRWSFKLAKRQIFHAYAELTYQPEGINTFIWWGQCNKHWNLLYRVVTTGVQLKVCRESRPWWKKEESWWRDSCWVDFWGSPGQAWPGDLYKVFLFKKMHLAEGKFAIFWIFSTRLGWHGDWATITVADILG